MVLDLKPHKKNIAETRAFLIKGSEPKEWLLGFKRLGIPLKSIDVYPIGGKDANSTWGCIAVFPGNITKKEAGKYELCQMLNNILFIPEYSTISPKIEDEDAIKLFAAEKHLFHPETGLVPLGSPIDWPNLILDIIENEVEVIEPIPSIFIPKQIIGYHIQPLPKEELLKELEEPLKLERFNDKPLSPAEKAKLKMYKAILGKEGNSSGTGGGMIGGFFGALANGLGKMIPGLDSMTEEMHRDLEDLERRNRNELEKLLDLMKDNPEEALKYAIPLDEKGTNRGGMGGVYNMTRLWGDFSIFGNNRPRSGGGGNVNANDHFLKLLDQYNKSAEELIKEKKFEKAAFVYMKLLKNYVKAAETMALGKFYQEAAIIYLKYAKNQDMAAECYEKGMYYKEAIDLYKELKKYEKAGDLLMKTHDIEGAYEQYTLLAKEYGSKHQYVKASLVYRTKMNDRESGQEILLKGWDNQKDAFNCLNNYFNNIEDSKDTLDAIEEVNANRVVKSNKRLFLKVISYEFRKRTDISEDIKELAYQIVSKGSIANPDIVDDLLKFNNDKELLVDTNRFKVAEIARKQGIANVTKNLLK